MPQRPVAFSRCSWRRICPGEMLTPLRVLGMRPGRSCQNKGTLSCLGAKNPGSLAFPCALPWC